MPIIKLNLPDELAMKLSAISANTESFILDLVRKKVMESDDDDKLAKEYQLAATENEQLLDDFKEVDSESWEDKYLKKPCLAVVRFGLRADCRRRNDDFN